VVAHVAVGALRGTAHRAPEPAALAA
jgi:hypothetical protein